MSSNRLVAALPRRVVVVGLVTIVATVAVMAASRGAAASDTRELTGDEIMRRVDELGRVRDLRADATLTTSGPSGVQVKRLTLLRRLDPDGVHYRSLARFVAPAEVRGEALLIVERADALFEIFLYLPRYRKTRRVLGESQAANMFGTSMSYADLAGPGALAQNHRLLRTAPCPGEHGTCYVVESTPPCEAARIGLGYARARHFVESATFELARSEFFAADASLAKVIVASVYRELAHTPRLALAMHLRVEDQRTGSVTELLLEHAQANVGLSANDFALERLGGAP